MADHTFVISDIHLADEETPHPQRPLWKAFKSSKHFVDASFELFLAHIQKQTGSSIELVFNGDIFDFDSVTKLPGEVRGRMSWLERRRGLASEEAKSRFKMGVILSDHPVWLNALRGFILNGNRVVFIFGNHDIELHWPSVQKVLIDALNLPEQLLQNIRFCEWFYVSNGDTLIEHGNQYDAYCLSMNPINPLIRKGTRVLVRLPFGNLAGKYMLNGMGLMNPHAESSFIKSSTLEYAKFYFKYVIRIQPLLLWTWFWSAMATMVYSVSEGLLPAVSDPLTIDARVEAIAQRSNVTSREVWSLKELHAHPAVFNPMKILRELWLDRAILLALILFAAFQIFSFMNIFSNVSLWWFVVPLLLLLPFFVFYARSIESEVRETQQAAFAMAPIAARIVGVKRVVHGHTHHAQHQRVNGIEYLNTGTWSPAFRDVECTQAYGRKCFAWIRYDSSQAAGERKRIAELFEWKDSGVEQYLSEGKDNAHCE